jgi:hypothetical protein
MRNCTAEKYPSNLSEHDLDLLGRALFEEQERLLPEGETWDNQGDGERSFWRMSAEAVIKQLRQLRK